MKNLTLPYLIIKNTIIFLTILSTNYLFAQQSYMECGWDANLEENEAPRNPLIPCMDIDEVLDDCIPIYINVNLHFFTNDDCIGNVQIANTTQSTAFEIGENLIDQANNVLANNLVQWGVPGAQAICNPLRYVLRGIYMHCKSNATGGFNTPNLQTLYSVNPTTEINVYFANYPGGPTGIGYSNGNFASIDWINTGNFNHEIGHVFQLQHSWDTDPCTDTPDNLTYDWDLNCDGIFDILNQQCWNIISNSDINSNGVNDCDESGSNPNCMNHPCCDWANINNNVMAYNAYQSAYTECQLRIMLQDLNDSNCDYVAQVGGCPPPNAFITQTPYDFSYDRPCGECLILKASFNDFTYLFEIYELVGGQETLKKSSGWTTGTVDDYCYNTKSPNFQNYLQPNKDFRAVLKVKNECGEMDSTQYFFTTTDVSCFHDPELDNMDIFPNPTLDIITLEFQANNDEIFSIYSTSLLSGQISVLSENFAATEGENTVEISLGSLNSGTYYITVLGTDHIYQKQIVKI